MSLPEKEFLRRMKLQQQVANDSPTQLVSKSFRSVEAQMARRNSLATASAPHILESEDSPLMFARRSLSERFKLQEGGTMGMEISPMSDLANNFSSSSLSPSPWRLSGKPKKLAFKVESSPEDENLDKSNSYSATKTGIMDSSLDSNASPGPMGALVKLDSGTPPFTKDLALLCSKDSTPLSSITNNPTRTKLQFGKKTARPPSSNTLLKPLEALDPENKENQNPYASLEFTGLVKEDVRKRQKSSKRSLVDFLPEDEASRDSGIGSQPMVTFAKRYRSKDSQSSQDSISAESQTSSMSMEELYQDLTPDQEGVSLLPESPESKAVVEEEGFNVNLLGTVMEEDEEEESGSLGLGISPLQSLSFLNAPILASSSLSALPQRPPMLRRAVSMKEPSRTGHLDKMSFKRPPPPHAGQERKKRRVEGEISKDPSPLVGICLPVFSRSVSETDLSIMKSCQVKEDTPDVLPDGSRLYCLPSVSHNQHRAITAHTMAEVLEGRYNHKIRSVRIIDCRYKFEFDGGHIRGAENWQHGEDDEFLNGFFPPLKPPLSKAPASYDAVTHDSAGEEKRDILVFHCEFSSKRGPDYCTKLRTKDRNINKDVYPGLFYPEVYLLQKGYKEFWTHHPDLCAGAYTEMDNPQFSQHLRTCRAKSKSWSGGTVSRTGRLSRMKI